VAFCNQFNYVVQGFRGFAPVLRVYCVFLPYYFFCLVFCFCAFVLLGLHVNKYLLNCTELDPDYDGTETVLNGDV